jgi:hypothetical protein
MLKRRILAALMPGCALGEVLYNEVKVYAPNLPAFKLTLNRLRQDELVVSYQYCAPGTTSPRALYALTDDGATHLATMWKYSPDHIRTGLPARNMIAHELAVVELVRTIRWEMYGIPYEAYYFDDVACKKYKKYLDLRGWIPDLLVEIKSIQNQSCRFMVAMEIDMGSRKLPDVSKTVRGRYCQTIFLCSTADRMRTIMAELRKNSNLHGMVYFSLLSEFCRRPGGIFSNNIKNLDGVTVSLYPR